MQSFGSDNLNVLVLLVSVGRPPSDVNGQFFVYICNPYCTYRNAVRASNFACALSRSPTMLSIPLVLTLCSYCVEMTCGVHC